MCPTSIKLAWKFHLICRCNNTNLNFFYPKVDIYRGESIDSPLIFTIKYKLIKLSP